MAQLRYENNQEPSETNCERISSYNTRYPASRSNVATRSVTNRVIYADGDKVVEFHVTAINNNDLESAAAVISITTSIIPPQLYPRSFSLSANNSLCVIFSWQPPEWPNGPITGYQYKCNDEGLWTNIEHSANKRKYQLCQFSPYQVVECELRAVNSAGNSNSATAPSVTTDCDASTAPRNIQFSDRVEEYNEGRVRLKYTVTWRKPETINCAEINHYITRYPNSSSQTVQTSTLSRVVHVDGEEEVTFYVYAVNDANIHSPVSSHTITSGTLKPQKEPTNVVLRADNSFCVSINWEPPQWPNGIITGYQYKRNTQIGTEWSIIGDVRRIQICQYTPYEKVQCQIKAMNSEGSSDVATTDEIRTLCSASTKPNNIKFNDPVEEMNDGRLRLKYIVTWEKPQTINCAKINHYVTRYPTATSQTMQTSILNRVVYADGENEVTFYVYAVNDANLQSPVSSFSTTSTSLRPQITPTNVSIQADNSSCVTISWKPPQWPNGVISGYQYKQSIKSVTPWTSIGDVRSIQICQYTPYEKVQCQIRAMNNEGNSNTSTTVEIRTLCAASLAPRSVSFRDPITTQQAGRERLMYTVNWQKPLKENCESISFYNTRYPASDSNITARTVASRNVYADGDTVVEFHVTAVNNDNLESAAAVISITTLEIRPQLHPTSVSGMVNNSTCITLSWQPPRWPNGPITGYQYKCNDEDSWTDIENSADKREYQLCKFSPYQVVKCKLRAVNSAGNSNSATAPSVTTDCDVPTLPPNLLKYITETSYKPKESEYHRRRIIMHIPKKDILANCREITLRQYKLNGSVDYTLDNQPLADLNAVTNYTIVYSAGNDEGFIITRSVVVTTGELEPGPVRVLMEPFNLSCISLSWTEPQPPNGIITEYQYRCRAPQSPDSIYTTTRERRDLVLCNYQSGDLVTCEVRASTAIGYGPASMNATTVSCGDPGEAVVFVDETVVHSEEMQRELVNVNITWMAVTANCRSIVNYSVSLSYQDEVLKVKTTEADERALSVEGLYPFTNYTVQITTTNNKGLMSHSFYTLITQETVKNISITSTDHVVVFSEVMKGFYYTTIILKPIDLMNVLSNQSNYQLIIGNIREPTRGRHKRTAVFTNSTCDSDSLYGYETAAELGITCYITAEIPGYPNIEVTEKDLSLSKRNIGIGVGLSVGVIIITGAVLIFLYKRRLHSKENSETGDFPLNRTDSLTSSVGPPVPVKPANLKSNPKPVPANPTLHPTKQAIPLAHLTEYISDKEAIFSEYNVRLIGLSYFYCGI
ncbi:phosphatidylinositol phosphatase PTPRQ-like [Watersipora subatra]|uniref:phosphatidylinositol phosphatase PTPRQ-like n=1 Tax=Watersipora subatra TaxID=2589382 RepID=UPI00355B9CE9